MAKKKRKPPDLQLEGESFNEMTARLKAEGPRDSDITTYLEERLSWRVRSIDMGGPFSFSGISEEKLLQIQEKLVSFETWTWNQILEGRDDHNHPQPCNSLEPEAQNRLQEIERDDVGTLFQLGMGGPARLWGIKDGAAFDVLWWDPNHGVYKSPRYR